MNNNTKLSPNKTQAVKTFEQTVRNNLPAGGGVTKPSSPQNMTNPHGQEQNYGSNEGVLSHSKDFDPLHPAHHPELIDNTAINHGVIDLPETFTESKRVVGEKGNKSPKVLIKAPISLHGAVDDSLFLHPEFQSTRREVTFHKAASKVFGLGEYVPETTSFIHPITKQPWSAQKWLPQASVLSSPSQIDHVHDLDKLAIMDTILGNNDRHFGNVLVHEKNTNKPALQLIDNAGAFDYGHTFATSVPAYARHLLTQNVSTSALRWIHSLSPSGFSELMHSCKVPEALQYTALNRLNEAKKWLNHANGNIQFNKSLGGLLAVLKTHKVFHLDETGQVPEHHREEQELQSKIRKSHYEGMHRGQIIEPGTASSDDETI